MAINYFESLGFGRAMDRPMQMAQNLSSLESQALNREIARQGMRAQDAQAQAQQSAFQDAQMRQRTAEASGLIYSALSSGQPQRAAQLAAQFEPDFKRLDPTFSAQQFAAMAQTPEGLQQLTQETLSLSQIMAGPEQMARFTAGQSMPEKAQQDPAKVLEFKKWLELNPNATQEEKRAVFNQMVVPQERALATGTGAGQARVATEQQLTPVLTERTRATEAVKLSEKQIAEQQQKANKDATAFGAYQAAANQVAKLSGAATGGIFGLAPAILENDRLFEGAIAIMRPAIKDVVRGAGEGTFTDADQELMNRMLPSRVDSPEVKAAKLNMLDNFVRAKLGQQIQTTPEERRNAFFGDEQQQPQSQPAQPQVGQYKIIEVR